MIWNEMEYNKPVKNLTDRLWSETDKEYEEEEKDSINEFDKTDLSLFYWDGFVL